MPIIPPSVARVHVEGSGPKRRPCGAPARCSVAITVPGCTRAVRATGSRSSTAPRWREVSSTMPGPTALPAIEVPAPRAVSGVPVARATSTTASTSSTCRGITTTWGGTR